MSGTLFVPVGLLLVSVLAIVVVGVVLPAVWSTSPTRRRAAASVLVQLLNATRPRR
ncbi:hypothetical protein MBT42_09165 [Streptomyces sp. MBT42]|uniref:hypothetical protein n=1 Tax=Streptomyces sp. MBT42 TaxID=1488373 RepID=UPI001E582F69|nr:hypothetical protein [Streptomyces sp. MBT42]MCD2463727.1 hypothetical protein [Streptomyces sp. MBT42]